MPVKQWFRELQPVQLYIILVLTIMFFVTELIFSHLTHALTLLMDSYHTLCNIMALTGCIITIKYDKNKNEAEPCDLNDQLGSSSTSIISSSPQNENGCRDAKTKKSSPSRANQERKLRNTFGWTRVDIITMLICCVFLASMCFSISIEACQTLVHIGHQDEMHHPISVLCIGAAGLLLNGVCYLLIGGYTFHQGSFLYVTESGDVILDKVVINDSVKKGQRRLSRTKNIYSSPPRQRQGLWEMMRDINGCILVMICAIIVCFVEKDVAKFVDPVFAVLSAMFIMILSYPYMKESGLILLQTIPDTINIDSLKAELLNHFPEIVNVHDIHVWQLTASKVISTVHIIFQNPKVYRQIINDVKQFLLENGITQVTIQPEFFTNSLSQESLASLKLPPTCLVSCQKEECRQNHCCPSYEDKKFKTLSHEVLPVPETASPELKSVRTLEYELPSLPSSVSSYSIDSSEYNENTKLHNEINKSLSRITELRANSDGNLSENDQVGGNSEEVLSDVQSQVAQKVLTVHDSAPQ